MRLVSSSEWQPQGIPYLEPRAWEALRQTKCSVLVTAGAGAGKTEFLAQKAAYLLQTGLCPNPKRILAISFKRDAAKTLAERVAKRCSPDQARRFDSFTFDAFTKQLLDRFRTAVPEPYRPSANYRIVMPHRNDFNVFLQRHGFYEINTGELEHAIANTPLPIEEDSDISRAVATFWRELYSEPTALSFAMINRLVELLLRENPLIKRALQLTYPFVFLDEFQDTTKAQFQLICTAFHGSHTVFTAVGDDKQQIMLWAGAMPDAFTQFEQHFQAQRITLQYNWRSHHDLVQIQHVIAGRIDPTVEMPAAQATRQIHDDIAAIWEFDTEDQQCSFLVKWLTDQLQGLQIAPHDFAILVRQRPDQVEQHLRPLFSRAGLLIRNVGRHLGDIAIQDLLSEELTQILLRLLRLGVTTPSPNLWSAALQDWQFLDKIDPDDEIDQQQCRVQLEQAICEMKQVLQNTEPKPELAQNIANTALSLIRAKRLQQAFSHYQRPADFDRVWNGFVHLLQESLQHANTWSTAFDHFEGFGQIPLMTIHKSKGLEFHTIIFYGLDNETWWSLKPDRKEELQSFFVAFTRAKQRAFFTLCKQHGRPIQWIEELLAQSNVRRFSPSL